MRYLHRVPVLVHHKCARFLAIEDLRDRVEGGGSFTTECVLDMDTKSETAVSAVEIAVRE